MLEQKERTAPPTSMKIRRSRHAKAGLDLTKRLRHPCLCGHGDRTHAVERHVTGHYRYLWDGSDPGWAVRRTNRWSMQLSLVFGEAGPDVREVHAMRRAVPAYAAMSAPEALATLRGKLVIDLGEFSDREARSVARACRDLGLVVHEGGKDQSSFLLVNEKRNACLLIEDEALNAQLCEEAVRRGLPVRYVEA